MFGSVVLDVAIGIVFIYLLLSFIASVVQEILAAFMQLRAANLQRGLQSLFSGESLGGKDLVNSIYSHGLVRGLYSDPWKDAKIAKGWLKKIGDALRTVLRKTIGITPTGEVQDVDPGVEPPDQFLLPSYIPARTFSLALIDVLSAGKFAPADGMGAIVASLESSQSANKSNKAGQALLALATKANGDLSAFQTQIENWYADAMDRASAWYKRYTQRVLLVIGLVLAALLNVDSVHVAQIFWTDRDVRQAMVDAASKYSAAQAQSTPAGSAPASADGNPPRTVPDLASDLNTRVKAFQEVTSTALLPIGWRCWPWQHEHYFRAEDLGKELRAVLGWLITALAISLGAPFWFDLLNKFMVVRSTVKPQEKSKDEGSKD